MAPVTAQRCKECGAAFAFDDRFCATCGAGRQPAGAAVPRPPVAAEQGVRRSSLALGRPLEFASAHGTEARGRFATPPSIATTTAATQSERRLATETGIPMPTRHRSWRKPAAIIVAALFICAIAVGGVYAIRVRAALHAMNGESTPSPSISASALGGSGNATIDTGAALTAVANARLAELTPSATGAAAAAGAEATATSEATMMKNPAVPTIASATEAPRLGSTASGTSVATIAQVDPPGVGKATTATPPASFVQPSPTTGIPQTPLPTITQRETGTATATAAATTPATTVIVATPTPAAVPAPGVVLSQIERIKNGDFELGDIGWNSDSGLQVVDGNAHKGTKSLLLTAPDGYADQRVFFVANTTYQLTVWAKMGSRLGAGEVGVIFRDGEGNRLSSGRPEMVAVQGDMYKEYTLTFTPPAEAVSVRAVFGKGGGGTAMSIDDVSVRSVVPPETAARRTPKPDGKSMTVLLMGVDARPGEAIDIGVRPDSLMVLHLDGETGACRLLSIPRDTRVELPGYGMTKINHALAVGGIDYEKLVVEKFLNVKIDHYVLLDFTGFTDLIDAVGGVRITVSQDFTSSDGTQFLAGDQEMTGKLALSYSLWRGGADGDFGRVERQHQVVQALVQKGSGLNIVRSINELLPAVENNLRTDLSPSQMASIASTFSSRCTAESVSMLTLQGSAATYDDPLLHLPLYYIEVDEAEVRSKVAALYEP